LNSDAPVDVQVVDPRAASCETISAAARPFVPQRPAHRGKIERAAAQHHHPLVKVGPPFKSQNRLESLSADHNRIDAGNKLGVAVGLAAALRQKVEIAVRPAMKPSTLVPIKTDAVIVNSSPVAA